VQVLAAELHLPIYLLSLTDPDMVDSSLARAFGRVPERCLLVIEDFEKIELNRLAITLPGLLNAVDGPLASEGRLLIVTANNASTISDIFLRPGRIDRRWEVGFPVREAVAACYDRFGPDGAVDKDWFLSAAKVHGWSMAKVQEELLVRTMSRRPERIQSGNGNVFRVDRETMYAADNANGESPAAQEKA
jgi:hypothetical protein